MPHDSPVRGARTSPGSSGGSPRCIASSGIPIRPSVSVDLLERIERQDERRALPTIPHGDQPFVRHVPSDRTCVWILLDHSGIVDDACDVTVVLLADELVVAVENDPGLTVEWRFVLALHWLTRIDSRDVDLDGPLLGVLLRRPDRDAGVCPLRSDVLGCWLLALFLFAFLGLFSLLVLTGFVVVDSLLLRLLGLELLDEVGLLVVLVVLDAGFVELHLQLILGEVLECYFGHCYLPPFSLFCAADATSAPIMEA